MTLDMQDDRPIESALMNAAIDPRDDLLRRLAEGRLTDEEREHLETEAAQDQDLARRLALYTPLDPTVVGQLDAIARTAGAEQGWRRAAATGLWAAAAAVVFMMLMPQTHPLPEHKVHLEGGRQATYRAVNASTTRSVTLTYGPTPVVWRVVPEEAPDSDTALNVSVLGRNGWQDLAVRSKRTPQGVFLIESTVASIFNSHKDARRLRFTVVPGRRPVRAIDPVPKGAWVYETDIRLQPASAPDETP